VTLPDNDIMIVNASTIVVGVRSQPAGADAAAAGEAKEPQPVAHRDVCFEEWTSTPVYLRGQLGPGSRLSGPAIIQQPDTTVLVEPNMEVLVDEHRNLIVELR
jgi:N-methylhydantoinase A